MTVSAFRVTVPATVANLGPGFDAFGMAVDLANDVTRPAGGPPAMEVHGEGEGELPRDAANLILRTMTLPGPRGWVGRCRTFRLVCENRIPLQRGLGSSSAAIVAGLLIADRLLGAGLASRAAPGGRGRPRRATPTTWPRPCSAACVSPTCRRMGGGPRRWSPTPDLRPVLLIPLEERLPTEDARRVAARRTFPRADATFNLSRVGDC